VAGRGEPAEVGRVAGGELEGQVVGLERLVAAGSTGARWRGAAVGGVEK
jgi:hypothetical protein